jgi:hypothetical protein
LRLLILLFLLFHTNQVLSETQDKVFKNKITENVLDNFFSSYKLVGQATYKFLLLDIYDAKLISETEQYPSEKFALILKYNRDFTKKSVVEETVKQLKIQRKYSDNELIKLKELLNKTFRPIKKNDYFIAMKLKDKGIFYFKDEKVLETKDIDFLNLFFNIWLREDSEDPNFTKSLLGKDK